MKRNLGIDAFLRDAHESDPHRCCGTARYAVRCRRYVKASVWFCWQHQHQDPGGLT